MDIPQPPKSATITSSPIMVTATRHHNEALIATKEPVSIEELKLEQGKVYQAVVSKQSVASTNTTTPQQEPDVSKQPTTTPAVKTSQKTTNTTTQEIQITTKAIDNEWLLKINNKLLLITSEKALKPQQILFVTIDSKNHLLVIQPENTSSLDALNKPTMQTINSALTNNSSISTLLSAMNHVMPRQVSLNTGLVALQQLSQQTDSKLVASQANAVLSLLSKQAPSQHLFSSPVQTNSNSPTSESPGLAFKASGAFFEASLKHFPNRQTAMMPQFKLVQETLSKLDTTQKLPLSQANLQQTVLSQTPGLIQKNTISAFEAIKSTLQASIKNNTLFNPSNNTQNTTNSFLTNSAQINNAQANNDLKSLLMSIISALNTSSPKPSSTPSNSDNSQAVRPYLDALAQLDLLSTPFNFPHIASTAIKHNAQAESILTDQQFTTGQLLKLLAGMLNRIQFNQLNSLYQNHSNTSDSNNMQSWFFELPVASTQNQLTTFDVRIDKDEAQQNETDKETQDKKVQWQIALSFNFEELGAIYVQVILTPPSISSTIWADRPETLALINRERPHFLKKLTNLGLNVQDIHCKKGQPKQNKTKLDRSLVDIKA